MTAHGHTTVWGTHIGVGRMTDAMGWYAQFKTWLAARHDAKLVALKARWDARREAVRSLRADAAIDMVASVYVRTSMTAL